MNLRSNRLQGDQASISQPSASHHAKLVYRYTFGSLACHGNSDCNSRKMSFGVYRPQMGVASGMRVLCSDQSLQDRSVGSKNSTRFLGYTVGCNVPNHAASVAGCSCSLCTACQEQRRVAESNGRQQARRMGCRVRTRHAWRIAHVFEAPVVNPITGEIAGGVPEPKTTTRRPPSGCRKLHFLWERSCQQCNQHCQ